MASVIAYSPTGGWQNLEVAAIGTVVAETAGGLAIAAGEVGFDATVGGKGIVETNGVLDVSLPGRGAKVSITTVGAGILTAAGIVAGLIERTGPVGAYNDTTGTAVDIIALLDNPAVGDSWEFTVSNGVAFAATMVAGAGVTLAGVTAITPSLARRYQCQVTGAATVTITGLGETIQSAGSGLALPGAITMFGAPLYTTQLAALTTAAVSALTTTGVASLATTQVSNLTTAQLTILCANNDLLVPAVLKIETDLNAVRTALQTVGIIA